MSNVISDVPTSLSHNANNIRPLVHTDIPNVSNLVWKVLHEKQGPAPVKLTMYFQEVFLENPWQEEGITSRVVENSQGKIVAFFGAVARRMMWRGKSLRFAFGSNFVVDPQVRSSMTAIQLVRQFIKGPQDVSITDSANENSRKLLRSLGFNIVPIYSLLWARPLRPLSYALHGVARLQKSRAAAMISTLARPINVVTDMVIVKAPLSPFRQRKPSTRGEELDLDTHLRLLHELPQQLLMPEYNKDSLKWIVEFVVRNAAGGESVRKVVVRDRDDKAIGWYLYYVNRGEVGEVLQLGANPTSIADVLGHLFYDAWTNGLIGLHGRLEPQFMEALTANGSIFLRNGSWTLAHSNNSELLSVLQAGNAFFSRMDGEWALRPPRSME